MNKYIQTAKTYITTRNKEFVVGVAVILGGIILVIVIALFIQNNTPKIMYQPAKACDLLNLAEAKELLGSKTVSSTSKDPVLSRSGNNAASECGYTDGNPDVDNMIVAAISVRSGVNDDGVQLNKTEFATNKASKNVEIVKDLGDSAYFNLKLGQLNVLEDRNWIIFNYGIGSAPETNTVDKAVELARKTLQSTATTSDL